jgi:hypothetical protein
VPGFASKQYDIPHRFGEVQYISDCDSDSKSSKAGRGRREKAKHEDLKGAKALALNSSAKALL